ncbi:hypothetical protein AHIOMGAK_003546 [Escherichia coli]|nr:hypothetical protein [Escherichia coli]
MLSLGYCSNTAKSSASCASFRFFLASASASNSFLACFSAAFSSESVASFKRAVTVAFVTLSLSFSASFSKPSSPLFSSRKISSSWLALSSALCRLSTLACSAAKKRATINAGGISSALYLALPITSSGVSFSFSPFLTTNSRSTLPAGQPSCTNTYTSSCMDSTQ